jgi:hypothetical protein
MNCPKCGGGSFLAEEDLIQVLGNAEPMKLLLKAIFQCRSCNERFVRIVYDDLAARKKPPEQTIGYQQPSQPSVQQPSQGNEPAEGLRFF